MRKVSYCKHVPFAKRSIYQWQYAKFTKAADFIKTSFFVSIYDVCGFLFNHFSAAELGFHAENLCRLFLLGSCFSFLSLCPLSPFSLLLGILHTQWVFNPLVFLLSASIFLLFIYAKHLPSVPSNQVSPSLFSFVLWDWPVWMVLMGSLARWLSEGLGQRETLVRKWKKLGYLLLHGNDDWHYPQTKSHSFGQMLSLHSSLSCRFQKLLPPLKLSRLGWHCTLGVLVLGYHTILCGFPTLCWHLWNSPFLQAYLNYPNWKYHLSSLYWTLSFRSPYSVSVLCFICVQCFLPSLRSGGWD